MARKMLVTAAICVILSYGVTSAATVALDNGGMNFGTGDMFRLSAGVATAGVPETADAYLALVLPDGTLVFLQLTPTGLAASAGTADPATWKPLFTNVTLPAGLDTGLIDLLDIPINDSILQGVYTSAFGLTQPGTLNFIDVEVKSFLVGRFSQPVSSYLGTYQGTWNNQTFGSSGSVLITVADTAAGSLTATMTLGGNVFGVGLSAPVVHTISLSPDGAIIFDGQTSLGMAAGTTGTDGSVNVTISQVGHGIDSVVLTGTIIPGNIDLVFTIHFTSSSQTATGTFKASRH